MKIAKIEAAPVIAGIGRDRILLKELRIPPIAAHEEAALVRFQTAKELTEPPDHYAIDYVHLHMSPGATERRIRDGGGTGAMSWRCCRRCACPPA